MDRWMSVCVCVCVCAWIGRAPKEGGSLARAGSVWGVGWGYSRPRAWRAVRRGRIAATAAPPEGPILLELRSKEWRLKIGGEVVKVCVCVCVCPIISFSLVSVMIKKTLYKSLVYTSQYFKICALICQY